MFRRSSTLPVAFLVLAVVFTIGLAGCGDDDDDDNSGGPNGTDEIPVVTEAMEGIWTYTTTARDCNTQEIIDDMSETGIDTLCMSEPMYEDEDDIFSDCEVTINDGDSFSINCDMTETLGECTMHYTYAMTVNYTSTTVSMTGRMQLQLSGTGCDGAEDECYDISTSATRTGAAPAGACGAKVAGRGLIRLPARLASSRH